MAIPNIDNQSVVEAIKYIDENGVPAKNKSTQYVLVTEEGKQYPPKYVLAVANYLANGVSIDTDGYNAVEAKSYFENRGYKIEMKQEKFELTITADNVVSTDDRFSFDNIGLGDNYEPIEAYFIDSEENRINRKRNRSENKISNQTLPRLACQIYENEILKLSDWDKENFPICKYNPNSETICGIYSTEEEFLKHRNSIEHLTYRRDGGPQFIFYSWNVFSTLLFVKECLKRFGKEGDKFILIYRDKTPKEKKKTDNDAVIEEQEQITAQGYQNEYSQILLESKNIIFRGAPGTGKSYLAKEIAADIISDGYTSNYSDLTDEQRQQVEFVQFHPSYDYSDFVEGLRPKMNDDGSIGFELQDGIFKKFVDKARKNYENSQKSSMLIAREFSAKTAMADFFSNIVFGITAFKTKSGNEFTITNVDDKHIYISIPGNATVNKLTLNIDEIQEMIESDIEFKQISDITNFFGNQYAAQAYSYDFAIWKKIKDKKTSVYHGNMAPETLKNYIFIIDEINRGEISKILGELFFSIDPGYRGKTGEVSTQYSNMHTNPNIKFYIPENVYVIGTMNDIDRSVDSFDFAMRRRFRFIEIKAEDTQYMLDGVISDELKTEAINRMNALNKAIIEVPDLNENYQIGASYFLKLKTLSFENLWTDYLQPLLQEYVRGLNDEEDCMKKFAKAYGYKPLVEGDADEATQD